MAQTSVADQLVERATGRARAKSAGEVEALLAAAEAVLAERGYAGLRVDDVLAEAGLSTRAFYRHFQGKSELFLAVFDREMHRADERLCSKVEEAADPENRVRAWIEATLALAYEPRLARRTRLFLAERHTVATGSDRVFEWREQQPHATPDLHRELARDRVALGEEEPSATRSRASSRWR